MPTSRPHRVAALAFSLLMMVAFTPAQTPAPAPLTTKLNVIVLDKTDAPVTDLRPEDLQVLEDGVPQPLTSVALEVQPVSYALVLDNTGSMRSQLNQVIDAGARLVSNMSTGDEAAVIRFVSSDNIERMQDFTADSGRLTNALSDSYIEGGQSALIDAVYVSAQYVAQESRRGPQRRRALVLLTDGGDRKSRYKRDDLLNLLRAADVQVFAVGLVQELSRGGISLSVRDSRDKSVELLNTLTKETGGRVIYPANPTELRAAVAVLNHELRTQYVITYTPTNQTRDGRYRKLEIKLADKPGAAKRTILARPGYVVPAGAK